MKLKSYLTASIIVWVAIILGTAFVLRDTPYFSRMLLIVGGGAVWFVVLTPGIFRER
jgi:hypothetical protein